jgi:hypothetical protein
MQKPLSIAVDTNFLLDLERRRDIVLDCLDTVKKRLPNCSIIVLPTVIIELREICQFGEEDEKHSAQNALQNILAPWGFHPVNCVPVGHGIVEQIGNKLRGKGLIPEEEKHDSFIIAEAALYPATILISSDTHIRDIDQHMLKIELDSSDVGCPIIASPWQIVNEFYG